MTHVTRMHEPYHRYELAISQITRHTLCRRSALICRVSGVVSVTCSVLQYVAVCCSVRKWCCQRRLRCVAECCSVLQRAQVALSTSPAVCCSVLQCVAVCCSVRRWRCQHHLQCVAVCCSVLQCVAVCCSVLKWCCHLRTLQHTATPTDVRDTLIDTHRCS